MQLNRVEGLEEGAELNWAALFSLEGSIYLYQILHIKGSYGGTDLFDATKKKKKKRGFQYRDSAHHTPLCF